MTVESDEGSAGGQLSSLGVQDLVIAAGASAVMGDQAEAEATTAAEATGETDRAQALLSWSDRTRRDLPWRFTRDPWAVLVSEFMAQQTQVARVVPAYLAFLDRFPTPEACASAPASAVIELWSGLGYNRRALMLHRSATMVTEEFGGAVPGDLEQLLKLPGVGPYTARAILAFAFERDVGVVDTNAARVLARWAGRTLDAREVQSAADGAVPDGTGWAWNQAILDLGAIVCKKRNPDCGPQCPVSRWCTWRGEGPDPAVGTAGVTTPQSRFEGSDRQGRGRLIDALRQGPVAECDAGEVMGWGDQPERVARVVAKLANDGMIKRMQGRWELPAS